MQRYFVPKTALLMSAILLLLGNAFLTMAQEARIDKDTLFRIKQSAIKPYEQMADDLIIKQFSASFLLFNPWDCHFTNNQGMSYNNTDNETLHDGYDFNCMPAGTPFDMKILLPLKIEEVGFDALYGNYVLARDLTGRFTFIFGHLTRAYVKPGQISCPWAPIFRTGTTGRSSGVHLHIEILKNGFPTQLDDSIFAEYKTIYKKQEKTPEQTLIEYFKITPIQAQQNYLQFVNNKIYPLSWYKLIAIAEYEKIPLPKLLEVLKGSHSSEFFNYYNYLVKVKQIRQPSLRLEEEVKLRQIWEGLEGVHFTCDDEKEKRCNEVEEVFQRINFDPDSPYSKVYKSPKTTIIRKP